MEAIRCHRRAMVGSLAAGEAGAGMHRVLVAVTHVDQQVVYEDQATLSRLEREACRLVQHTTALDLADQLVEVTVLVVQMEQTAA